jgi:hypothetical protein
MPDAWRMLKMAPVAPTGKCFCGCGETTEPTAFFVSGHDRKAEAKVVREVYGSVAELLIAHGYGPDGRDPSAAIRDDTDTTGIQLLEQWSKRRDPKVHVTLEVLNLEDRGGPRQRIRGFHVIFSPNHRAFCFERCLSAMPGEKAMTLTVPLPDIVWVFRETNPQSSGADPVPVVRLRGAVTSDPVPRFLPFG